METDHRLEETSSSTTKRVTASAEESRLSKAPPAPKPVTPEPAQSPSKTDDDILTNLFQFLSTATPGTLSAVAVGLAAITYFILGQIGLLLIGALGGIVLYIQWEASNPDYVRAVRGEKGIDVLARVLGERTEIKGREIDETDSGDDEEQQFVAQSFADFQPETQDALNDLVEAVIRDYVKWWYEPIVPSDSSFPLSCRKILTSFLVSVSNHLSRKRPADGFLDFLTNTSSIVIVFFSELSGAFSGLPADSAMSAPDAVYNYLASNPESNLSHLLSQRQQATKFKAVAEDLLGFLERHTYDCDPARTFLREILASVILEKSLQTCSRPEWINGWIVYLLEAGEPDFSQAIDAGMSSAKPPTEAVTTGAAFADIDGNVGNIALTKGNRNSFDTEKARRRESVQFHKKKLSKTDEAMENAMEEMKRMNEMLVEQEVRKSNESNERNGTSTCAEASHRLAGVIHRNANDLDMETNTPSQAAPVTPEAPSPDSPDLTSPTKASLSEGRLSKEVVNSPMTPGTVVTVSQTTSPPEQQESPFTNFDQLVPSAQDDAESSDAEPQKPPPLSLHNATITIYDDGTSDKSRIRSKPVCDYLIQIEPSSSHYSGWMIVRQYADFEKLHEVLRRIAAISGITAFAEQHTVLPAWKQHTRSSLRGELERYVRDACWYKPLAESEGMKRFLEKDQGHSRTESKTGFQAFENMGKNVFGVLANSSKGVAEGSKVLAGGVTGMFGNIGLARKTTSTSSFPEATVNGSAGRLSISTTPSRMDSSLSLNGPHKNRDSMDSQRSSVISTQPGKLPTMERRPSYQSQGEVESPETHQTARSDRWERRSASRASSISALRSPLRSPSTLSLDALKLPPPPDAMPDDYGSPVSPGTAFRQEPNNMYQQVAFDSTASVSSLNQQQSKNTPNSTGTRPAKPTKQHPRLSEQETRVAVELIFAIINELYTLSSAWNFRRTLLAAAKSFLLRPGNPSLTSIQNMIQEAVLEANTSDEGMAAHLRKLRENSLPTEEELKAWPAELTAEEKEKLRVKARKLLIQSGVPAALSGVMGANATSEAMGRIFDCLQIEEVARGLIFGVILQAVRIITH